MHEILKSHPNWEPVAIGELSAGRSNLNEYERSKTKNIFEFDDNNDSDTDTDTDQLVHPKASPLSETSTRKLESNVIQLPRSKKTKLDLYWEKLDERNTKNEKEVQKRCELKMELERKAVDINSHIYLGRNFQYI